MRIIYKLHARPEQPKHPHEPNKKHTLTGESNTERHHQIINPSSQPKGADSSIPTTPLPPSELCDSPAQAGN